MTRPVVGSIAEEIYASLAAYAPGDETRGWALLHISHAIGMQNQVIRDVTFDDDSGIGWSVLFDIDRCPDWALDWLGQFVGVRIPRTLTTEADRRAWVKDAAGWRRGRVSTLEAAVSTTLTGDRRVVVRSRFDPASPNTDAAGHIQIKTYTSQTPDPVVTERMAMQHVRGGLIGHYTTVDGQDWLQAGTTYATWGDLEAAFATWGEAEDAIPS